MLVKQLGLLAAAVYSAVPGGGHTEIKRHAGSGSWNGFQAAAYQLGSKTVVAFRGTDVPGDVATDIVLGVGANSSYFSMGEAFVASVGHVDMLCGHSLGGAIAQVVANRTGIPMVTFNAPGVGVVASRNVATGTPVMHAVRLSGMAISAAVSPVQAAKDMVYAFRPVRGLNVCLENDIVSRIGLHYGDVIRIAGTSANPATEHGISTMNAVLKEHEVGNRVVG